MVLHVISRVGLLVGHKRYSNAPVVLYASESAGMSRRSLDSEREYVFSFRSACRLRRLAKVIRVKAVQIPDEKL